MQDLSLHILDMIENSLRAGATAISITIEERSEENSLAIMIEDNGCGIDVPFEKATDPFYTTKKNKRIGMGLPMFRHTAETSGGRLMIEKSSLGGTMIKAVMRLRHINRRPMGDLAATLAGIVCTHPDVDMHMLLIVNGKEYTVDIAEIRKNMPSHNVSPITLSREVHKILEEGIEVLDVQKV